MAVKKVATAKRRALTSKKKRISDTTTDPVDLTAEDEDDTQESADMKPLFDAGARTAPFDPLLGLAPGSNWIMRWDCPVSFCHYDANTKKAVINHRHRHHVFCDTPDDAIMQRWKEATFACIYCNQRFTTGRGLRQHTTKQHKG